MTIGVAVVEHKGRFLVGIRPQGKPLAGYAEFPGGKCEAGETPERCAARECAEETGLAVRPVRLLERVTWDYPHGRVELHFWLCGLVGPDDNPRSPFRWTGREELATLRFPEANAGVKARLVDGES